MAERDFDAEFGNDAKEGHRFTLGGFTFHTPPVAPPGAFVAKGRGLMAAVAFLRAVVVPEDRANLERVFEMPDVTPSLVDTAPELLNKASDLLAALAIQEGVDEAKGALQEVVERAQAVETREGPIVSAAQVDQVAEWLMEATIGRPTQSPSSSSSGAGRTSNGSKGASRQAAKAGKT